MQLVGDPPQRIQQIKPGPRLQAPGASPNRQPVLLAICAWSLLFLLSSLGQVRFRTQCTQVTRHPASNSVANFTKRLRKHRQHDVPPAHSRATLTIKRDWPILNSCLLIPSGLSGLVRNGGNADTGPRQSSPPKPELGKAQIRGNRLAASSITPAAMSGHTPTADGNQGGALAVSFLQFKMGKLR
jgi:hypothetical protein